MVVRVTTFLCLRYKLGLRRQCSKNMGVVRLMGPMGRMGPMRLMGRGGQWSCLSKGVPKWSLGTSCSERCGGITLRSPRIFSRTIGSACVRCEDGLYNFFAGVGGCSFL